MHHTRRSFITRIGLAGGYGAAFTAMQALGLLPAAAMASQLPDLSSSFGAGKKVAILGAGIAGLVSAYELGKAGFACTVLEARARPGGRAWTVRNGTRVEFTDGTVQTCTWDEGHYMNCGPARIPSIHTHYLGYAKQLGVAMEVEINTSRSALMQAGTLSGGKPVEQRQVVHDTRGYIAELLAKAINAHTLDDALTDGDTRRMLDFLRQYGDLNEKYAYVGTPRAGYRVDPGAGPALGELREPLPLHELLISDFSTGELYEEQIDWQATMFQPVGGMDRLPYAFAKALGPVVQYETPVQEIRKTANGVRIVYSHAGETQTLEADYCICTLPLPILRQLKTDFSPAHQQAIAAIPMNMLYKIAWESPRFWETEDHIYGGISFLKRDVNIVWYPSAGLFTESGVIIAGFGPERDPPGGELTPFGKLSVQGKLDASRAAVEALHPGRSGLLAKPIYVAWEKIPYSLGCIADVESASSQPAYDALIQPDGRLLLAGDYVSRLVGWQEGAILSAHRAIALISEQMKAGA
jgi:monoamine oxidase